VPIPRQPALATEDPAVCPVADRICREVLSLPLHPDLAPETVDAVVEAVTRAVRTP
jgi:dTDP-4-amino-4,6-dideoxygalactose transaminase